MAADPGRFHLKLYVSGATPRSARAISNIKAVIEQRLSGRCDLEVIDAGQQADLLRLQQIAVLPTLVRHLPLPMRRMVGDLSDNDQLLFKLGLAPEDPAGGEAPDDEFDA
jgi:circadian clock protein KaiB